MKQQRYGQAGRRGFAFTLIELLVVIAIIALLASLVVPTFGFVAERIERAECMNRQRGMGNLVMALAAEKTDRSETGWYEPYFGKSNSFLQWAGGVSSLADEAWAIRDAGERHKIDWNIVACPSTMIEFSADGGTRRGEYNFASNGPKPWTNPGYVVDTWRERRDDPDSPGRGWVPFGYIVPAGRQALFMPRNAMSDKYMDAWPLVSCPSVLVPGLDRWFASHENRGVVQFDRDGSAKWYDVSELAVSKPYCAPSSNTSMKFLMVAPKYRDAQDAITDWPASY